MREGASQKGLSAAPTGQAVSSSTGSTDSPETARSRKTQASPGLEFPRFFSTAGADPFSTAVAVTIGRLRRKLGEPPVITTTPRVGYRIAGAAAPGEPTCR